MAKIGLGMKPHQLADLLIVPGRRRPVRAAPLGMVLEEVPEKAPRGVVFHEQQPIKPVKKVIKTKDKKIPMADPRFLAELQRLEAAPRRALSSRCG